MACSGSGIRTLNELCGGVARSGDVSEADVFWEVPRLLDAWNADNLRVEGDDAGH